MSTEAQYFTNGGFARDSGPPKYTIPTESVAIDKGSPNCPTAPNLISRYSHDGQDDHDKANLWKAASHAGFPPHASLSQKPERGLRVRVRSSLSLGIPLSHRITSPRWTPQVSQESQEASRSWTGPVY